MERLGAQRAKNAMRKRTLNNKLIITDRSQGLLTEQEIEEIRLAYQNGCRGSVLIGLKGEERIFTMLLPPRSDQHSAEEQMRRSIAKLQEIGCDEYIHIYRARVSPKRRKDVGAIILICQFLSGADVKLILPLDEGIECKS